MTPEERFNQQVWWILQEIRKEQFYEPEDGKDKVGFSIRTQENHATPSPDEQRKLLNTLKGWGIFELRPRIDDLFRGNTDLLNPTTHFILTINLPKFEETYTKFQKACDLNSYLNDYQQKVFKGKKKLPEFSKVATQGNLKEGFNGTGKTDEKVGSIYHERNKSLVCGELKLDVDQSVIQYKDNPPQEISTGINTIKLLITLMENKRVVEYTEIAQKLKLNCYHEGVENKDVAREVQFLKRDLGKFLEKIGMSKTEIQKMFISKKNVGYKLRYGIENTQNPQ